MEQLNNKVIFLTGGTEGIGYECAKAYSREGAHVVVASISEKSRLDEVMEELGASHLGILCDVSNANDVRSAIKRTLEVYGRIDAIHNNAGIAHPSSTLHETSNNEWDRLMNVNLK